MLKLELRYIDVADDKITLEGGYQGCMEIYDLVYLKIEKPGILKVRDNGDLWFTTVTIKVSEIPIKIYDNNDLKHVNFEEFINLLESRYPKIKRIEV